MKTRSLAAAIDLLAGAAVTVVAPAAAPARADTPPALPAACRQPNVGGTVTCTYGYTGADGRLAVAGGGGSGGRTDSCGSGTSVIVTGVPALTAARTTPRSLHLV